MTESLLLACTQISTFWGATLLTRASGFFFERDGRLHVVTSRHVVFDPGNAHAPDRIGIDVHVDRVDLTRVATVALPLYDRGTATWRQATDTGGEIDVATVPIDRAALPSGAAFEVFTPDHLQANLDEVEIGAPLSIVGFPLGFHDTTHHLPVARQAAVASAFGVRFQGRGWFLTDARTHRGMSGAPVVMRAPAGAAAGTLPWRLLGIHSTRMDMGSRDLVQDESLGLNGAWYADVLRALTEG
ncbi:MAG: serine protease [Burkholderiales bacterium]